MKTPASSPVASMNFMRCALALTGLLLSAELMAKGPSSGNSEILAQTPITSSIQRNGDLATMIVQFSYKRMKTGYVYNKENPVTYYYNSSKAVIEFDCRLQQSRILKTIFFSDVAAKDNVVHEQNVSGNWQAATDHQSKNSLIYTACHATPD